MLDTENTVPEITAANPDGGAENLNADPISQSTSDQIDALLDAVESEGSGADKSQDNSGQFSRNVQANTEQPQGVTNQNSGTSNETFQQDIDPEIAAIQTPPGMSEKQVSNWEKLRKTATEYKKQAAEVEILRQKLAEAQTQQPQLPQDYEELRRFRSTFDLRSDPEFQAKYDKPIKDATEGIYNLLRKHRAGEEVIKSIQDAGGPGKVSKSWWKKNAIDKLYQTEDGFTDARRLENALVQIDDTEAARQAEVEESAVNQEQWIQQKEAERQKAHEQEHQHINTYIEDVTKNVPWARFQEIPPGATQEQVDRVQKHNAGVQDLHEKFSSALYPKSPTERAAVAAAATLSHVVTNQLRFEQGEKAKLQGELGRLQKELAALKSSGRMPKQTVSGQPSKTSSLSDRLKMNSSAAIDMGLDEAGL
jgi:hypothetical protein